LHLSSELKTKLEPKTETPVLPLAGPLAGEICEISIFAKLKKVLASEE
jgi:hypothetical protein